MQEINVGHIDSVIRIVLGLICLGLIAYHFFRKRFLRVYLMIPIVVLVPFFLKTGITKVCPIMKAMHISTTGIS